MPALRFYIRHDRAREESHIEISNTSPAEMLSLGWNQWGEVQSFSFIGYDGPDYEDVQQLILSGRGFYVHKDENPEKEKIFILESNYERNREIVLRETEVDKFTDGAAILNAFSIKETFWADTEPYSAPPLGQEPEEDAAPSPRELPAPAGAEPAATDDWGAPAGQRFHALTGNPAVGAAAADAADALPVAGLVERFERRWTEPFELSRSEV